MSQPPPIENPFGSWQKAAFAGLLLTFFLYFSWDSLQVPFAADDMMNMDNYWRIKPLKLMLAQLTPWLDWYRPMGGLFYMPLLFGFGLNPAPYHAVILLCLLAGVALVYRLARLLGCGELEAGIAALIPCYHAGLSPLYYNIAYVYDVLCGFFYLAALVYYTGIRARGRLPRNGETVVFMGLFLCALNSKEMAVTMPAILLAYEWFYHKAARWNWKSAAFWLRGPGRVAMFCIPLNLLYLYGKMSGPHAMGNQPGYRMIFSMHRIWEFWKGSLGDLFFTYGLSRVAIVLVWTALFYLAFRRNRPLLRFAWLFIVVTPLPLEFLLGRGEACLYIPLAGWAIFVSVVFFDAARAVASFLAGEPAFRVLGRQALLAAIVGAAVIGWAWEGYYRKENFVRPVMARTGQQTGEVIRQLQALRLRVRPQSEVIFLNDPFPDWDMVFIADLWLRDRSVKVRLQRKTPYTPEELARAEYVFAFENGRLVQAR